MTPPTSHTASSFYLHPAQCAWIAQLRRSWLWRLELPTWLLIATVYSGWFGVVMNWHNLGPWLGTPLLILFTTWYMSLQHELIHGHPTRWRRVNQLFGLLPLAVWYPYGLYRDSHLQHHRNEQLTVPGEDPEGYYFTPQQWQRFPPLMKRVIRLRNTFIGRLTLGPVLDILGTLADALRAVWQRKVRVMLMWGTHIVLLALLLHWMVNLGLSPLYFVLAIGYPSLSLTKVRSFFEHRAEESPQARSTINEAGWAWRLLFLNLNYHLVHHDLPGVPWYGLRRVYLAEREQYQLRSQGFLVKGYSEWIRVYAFTPVQVEAHPFSPVHELPVVTSHPEPSVQRCDPLPSLERA